LIQGPAGPKGEPGDPGSTEIENITGLQDALDGKAAEGFSESGSVEKAAMLWDTAFNDKALELRDGEVFISPQTKEPFRLALDAAPSSHTHAIADTTGLQDALDGKVDAAPNEAIPGVALRAIQLYDAAQDRTALKIEDTVVTFEGATYEAAEANGAMTAAAAFRLAISAASTAALDGKVSNHVQDGSLTEYPNVAPAALELRNKEEPNIVAVQSHTHAIADVTGLQDELDSKASTAALDALEARVLALEAAQAP
jgi:hypothetical protein